LRPFDDLSVQARPTVIGKHLQAERIPMRACIGHRVVSAANLQGNWDLRDGVPFHAVQRPRVIARSVRSMEVQVDLGVAQSGRLIEALRRLLPIVAAGRQLAREQLLLAAANAATAWNVKQRASLTMEAT